MPSYPCISYGPKLSSVTGIHPYQVSLNGIINEDGILERKLASYNSWNNWLLT